MLKYQDISEMSKVRTRSAESCNVPIAVIYNFMLQVQD